MAFYMPYEAKVLGKNIPQQIPTNYTVDGSRKARVSLKDDSEHVYSLAWVDKEGSGHKVPFQILTIEVSAHKTRAKVLPDNIANAFVSDTTFGFVALLKCEVAGEYAETQMRLPPGVTLAKALTAAGQLSEGMFTTEMGTKNGIFVKKNLI